MTQPQSYFGLFPTPAPPVMQPYLCDNCKIPLHEKKGQYGSFLACPNYNSTGCKFTLRMDGTPNNKKAMAPPPPSKTTVTIPAGYHNPFPTISLPSPVQTPESLIRDMKHEMTYHLGILSERLSKLETVVLVLQQRDSKENNPPPPNPPLTTNNV